MKREQVRDLLDSLFAALLKESADGLKEKLEAASSIHDGLGFAENTPAERSCFFAAWNDPSAVSERASLAGFAGSASVETVLATAEAAIGIAAGIGETIGGNEKESMRAAACAEIGSIVFDWLEQRDAKSLRKLADALEGKQASASDWKRRIGDAFANLCNERNFAILPTKKEVQDAVVKRWRNEVRRIRNPGEGLDERRFRRYMKALGLSGLPTGKPGPKTK